MPVSWVSHFCLRIFCYKLLKLIYPQIWLVMVPAMVLVLYWHCCFVMPILLDVVGWTAGRGSILCSKWAAKVFLSKVLCWPPSGITCSQFQLINSMVCSVMARFIFSSFHQLTSMHVSSWHNLYHSWSFFMFSFIQTLEVIEIELTGLIVVTKIEHCPVCLFICPSLKYFTVTKIQ